MRAVPCIACGADSVLLVELSARRPGGLALLDHAAEWGVCAQHGDWASEAVLRYLFQRLRQGGSLAGAKAALAAFGVTWAELQETLVRNARDALS